MQKYLELVEHTELTAGETDGKSVAHSNASLITVMLATVIVLHLEAGGGPPAHEWHRRLH